MYNLPTPQDSKRGFPFKGSGYSTYGGKGDSYVLHFLYRHEVSGGTETIEL